MSEEHHETNYYKIWAVLLVLLVISVLGPLLGIRAVTLITAFGIAFVKAYLVAKHFMHVTVQPKFVVYLLSTCLVLMLLFFAGVSPDVMAPEGERWQKPLWLEEAAEYERKSTAEHDSDGEHDSHGSH